MDSGNQVFKDIGSQATAGILVTGFAAFAVWFRRLVGLPKRVKALENVNPIILQTLNAQSKMMLAQNAHRRESDKTPEYEHAEKMLREADEAMDQHLFNSVTGDKK